MDLKIKCWAFLLFSLFVLAIGVVVLWSLWKDISWSTGHSVVVPMLMHIALILVNLLNVFLQLQIGQGNSMVTAIKFFSWYLIYGGLFSLTQKTISIATESNLSPQWLFQFQVFLETNMGLAFVQLNICDNNFICFSIHKK